ncbi:MAG: hypothetical protein QM639_17755 [Rhodocyclaceae bacterium]
MTMKRYWASALAVAWVAGSLGMLWHTEARAALRGVLCTTAGGHS